MLPFNIIWNRCYSDLEPLDRWAWEHRTWSAMSGLLMPHHLLRNITAAAAAAKSLQSCPTLCNPRDSSPPGSPVPGILQARTLEWVAISFSSAWKWKVKVKSLSRVWLLVTPRTAAYQAPLSLSPGKSTGVGCHCFLHRNIPRATNTLIPGFPPCWYLSVSHTVIWLKSVLFYQSLSVSHGSVIYSTTA